MAESSGFVSKTRADLIYESFYSGAVGGSVVALFFLVIDALQGEPLFTPSLMGMVLFSGESAESVVGVHLDMVAWYSLVHFAIFGLLGTGMTLLVHAVGTHFRHPLLVLLLAFGVFEAAFVLVSAVALPGVMGRLGALPIAAANLLAAGAMGTYLLHEHRPGLFARPRHAAHPG
ncbi:MAG: hypothetical protein QNK04_19525 [Myxococcota bacterium]|nr:hypothetical protein [Myxococcota bacterium]